MVVLLFTFFRTQAQQAEHVLFQSAGSTGLQAMFYKCTMVAGPSGSNYVAGATLNSSGNYDIIVTKLNASNQTVWVQTWDGGNGGDDYAADLKLDSGGNLLITGTKYISATNYDAVTLKYNASGTLQWATTYNGASSLLDGGTCLLIDGSDNVYVGGGSMGATTGPDFLVVKYNSSGTQQWAQTWNSPSGLQDMAAKLSFSGSTVIASGVAQQTSTSWKLAQARYATSNGAFSAYMLSGGDSGGMDRVGDMRTDASGNVYVTGGVVNSGNGYDVRLYKLDDDLDIMWQEDTDSGDQLDDEGLGIVLMSNGDPVVCGYSTRPDEGKNAWVRRYDASDGDEVWTYEVDLYGGDDELVEVKTDSEGNLILCGSAWKHGNADYLVIKLDGSDGSLIWKETYNSASNADDHAFNVALSQDETVLYVAGQVSENDTTMRYEVAKWLVKELSIPQSPAGLSGHADFTENRGQLRNADSTANETVRFYGDGQRFTFFADEEYLNFQVYARADTADTDTICRISMQLTRGVEDAPIYGLGERKQYSNYYLGHMNTSGARTRHYDHVVKPGVYAHTDAYWLMSTEGWKQYLVAGTGASPSLFEMTFDGYTSLSADTLGNLLIGTDIGPITLTKAKAYSYNATTGALTLLGWQPDYYINSGTGSVTFANIGSWSDKLVIEISEKTTAGGGGGVTENYNLKWSTFFGGNGTEVNYTVKNDDKGLVWYGGSSSATFFMPYEGLNIGNFSNGTIDSYVAHFDVLCVGKWRTFYGGNSIDTALALDLVQTANSVSDFTTLGCVVVGETGSTNLNTVAGPVMIDNSLNGEKDGMYFRLDLNGQLTAHSYVGGDGDEDKCTSVVHRPSWLSSISENTFIGGYISSGTNFPYQTSNGAFYQTYQGGSHDGFILRLNSQNQPDWCTSFGGNDKDAIFSLAIVAGDLVIVGSTKTENYSSTECTAPSNGTFPSCAPGDSWQQSEYIESTGDVGNGFIARFDHEGELKYSTFFGRNLFSFDIEQVPILVSSHFKLPQTGQSAHRFFVAGVTPRFLSEDFPFPGNNDYGHPWAQQPLEADFPEGSPKFYYLACFNAFEEETIPLHSTALDWIGEKWNIQVSASANNGVVLSGTCRMHQLESIASWSSWYPNSETNTGDFPIYSEGEMHYLEDNLTTGMRSFVMQFDYQFNLKWSTLFGSNPINYNNCVSSVGDYIFIGGRARNVVLSEPPPPYTLWTFDLTPGSQDYYLNTLITSVFNENQHATITRFSNPLVTEVVRLPQNETSYLNIFPNPSSDLVSIRMNPNLQGLIKVRIFNSSGAFIQSYSLESDYSFSTKSWSPGLYLIEIYTEGRMEIVKLIKLP